MWASAFKPTFWTQYRPFLAWTALASSFSASITSCLERLFLLVCSTASSAAWITWSKAFLWHFAVSFSNHSQCSASHCDLAMASTSVSSSRSLWLFWGDSLWDLSLGSLDGQHSGPSCLHPSFVGRESLWGFSPDLSFLVWQVCNWPSRERLVSSRSWYFFLNPFMRWLRLDREACVSACLSSMFLIALATASAELSTTFFTSGASSSQVSLSSNLLVGQQRIEHDCKQSSLSFHLERRDVLSHSLGGSCPYPPCTVLSGTALPLPLSGGMTSYSSSMSLVLGDSYAPVFNPPPMGGGFVVVSQSVTLLVSSSWDCELRVTPVRFAPDCAPVLLFDCLGCPTFHFTIRYRCCEAPLIVLHCDELSSSPLLQ